MPSNNHVTDIVIIGAGPVGLFAIFEAGMLTMQCHVIDTLDAIGGQCMALYPEKPIYDIPAHPAIDAQDLIAQLEKQAAPFKPTYHLGQRVDKVTRQADGGFEVVTSTGTTILCKAVVIAAGCGAFGPNRPPLTGIEAYEGKSVHYMVTKRSDFAGKNIVIAGGGDSAVDWTLSLAPIAKKVYVVHRRDQFRCAPESVERMKKMATDGNVEMIIPYQLHGLEGSNGQLSAVIVKTLDGQERSLPADTLLPFFGLSMELGPIANWGLGLDKKQITVTPSTMQSTEAGIYAIGDVATYPGKLKLILSGFAEAAMACHHAYALVYPGKALHFEYSTTKGVAA